MTVLVTGGAGYIGAHVVRLLQEAGRPVVVVDDLSTGDEGRLGGAPLVRMDLSAADAPARLGSVFDEHEVDAVIHFAAKKEVGVSVERPTWYYRQNVGGLTNLLDAVEAAGVRDVVFSSSAAVYGMPDISRVDEDAETLPINPYGETKLVGEWMLRDASRAGRLRVAALRYFNVAGAGWDDLGDPVALNLVTIVLDRLHRGLRPLVYGDDYPTVDGTGVRDYVHVLDLARAHLAVLDRLGEVDEPFEAFNVGTGHGASVLQVVREVERAAGVSIEPELVARRPGDPAELVADASKIQRVAGWRAEYGLEQIIDSAVRADRFRRSR
ncbi:UDP-glucose 4-epimerase GalE [Agromyces archimandritae]|uniref:UDP-glucose 4-epimerase n=1 Tax=Agromyces archimandritae TaxID=2781962 RepID=A0A975IPH5_9MICO|nr:UDP-glucose 4-epimerase GalE [Agromyces archimandritae]QTX05284.1 UDP-glucose 4-epimerase GalE [Agromyces archimandritae]